jgi:hypothetical protein
MTAKERAYKTHLVLVHDTVFDPDCAPLLCGECGRLGESWAGEVLCSVEAKHIYE